MEDEEHDKLIEDLEKMAEKELKKWFKKFHPDKKVEAKIDTQQVHRLTSNCRRSGCNLANVCVRQIRRRATGSTTASKQKARAVRLSLRTRKCGAGASCQNTR